MNPRSRSWSSAPSFSAPPGRRSPAQQLAFRLRHRGDIVVLAARGEADAFTLPLWRREVRKAVDVAAAESGTLIVDTTRLDFLSLRTLATLAEDAQTYRENGVEICLVAPNPRIAGFAATDPRTARLPVRSTVVSALTALHPQRRTAPRRTNPQPYRPPQIAPPEPEPWTTHDRVLRDLAQRN